MRRLRKTTASETRGTARKPMAEGIIPLDQRGRRIWSALSDEELVSYAQGIIDQGKGSRTSFSKGNVGLCKALRKRTDGQGRRLYDRLEFKADERAWHRYSDEELVGYAQKYVTDNGIPSIAELNRRDSGIYQALKRKDADGKKLVSRLEFPEGNMNWQSMSDSEMTAFAQEYIEKNGIRSRTELVKKHLKLYTALKREDGKGERVIGRLRFPEGQVKWRLMGNKELIAYGQGYVDENGIRHIRELMLRNSRLFNALLRDVGDGGRALDRVVFPETRNRWAKIDDEGLVEFGKKFLEENRISTRKELYEQNGSLYSALLKRKLMEQVFAGIDRKENDGGLQEIADALGEFCDD
jgi:hypothetical protein